MPCVLFIVFKLGSSAGPLEPVSWSGTFLHGQSVGKDCHKYCAHAQWGFVNNFWTIASDLTSQLPPTLRVILVAALSQSSTMSLITTFLLPTGLGRMCLLQCQITEHIIIILRYTCSR